MAYSVTVNDLIESNFDFGLDKYTIFDEEYREILNNAILEYYRYREICFQNPYKWRHYLQMRIDLIMRNEFNDLYNIKKTEFNPLYNIEIEETFSHNIDNSSKAKSEGTSNNNSSSKSLNSMYPNQKMSNEDLDNPLYINSGQKVDGESVDTNSQEDSTNGNMKETYKKLTKGSSAGLPFSKALIQFKQYVNQFNLDQQVINRLSDLFMTVY